MLGRYVWADLVRNPRRSLATMVGVALGIGLSCGILFFIDGLSSSMTQRAVASLSVDMQRVLTDPVGADLLLRQRIDSAGEPGAEGIVTVHLELANQGLTPAHEVILRSQAPTGMTYVPDSASVDGGAVAPGPENPLAHGPAATGLNLGTVAAGQTRVVEYRARPTPRVDGSGPFRSLVSSREAPTPVAAGAASQVDLAALVDRIAGLDGVAFAEQLSLADLAPGALAAGGQEAAGPVRVLGLAPSYLDRDRPTRLLEGSLRRGEALVSVEVADELDVSVGNTVVVALPDRSTLEARVSGVVDLTQARALFASRKGADLETFVYVPRSIVVDPETFAAEVLPAFERAAAERNGQLKDPPVREVDVGVDRNLLDADPGTALAQTRAIAGEVTSVASSQGFLLDNISNTLAVARDDAGVAKRMFVFLGVPGGVLAATLAGYAGNVLAAAQRREQATLRIRGASRRHLLRMLAARVACLTVAGALVGVGLGYGSAALVLGHDALTRASTASLVASGVVGALSGLLATATALYVTGRRSIDREIAEDRARVVSRPPVWRRGHLDVLGLVVVAGATVAAVAGSAFEGSPGSVYVGRSVELSLPLLALPLGAWIAACLFGARGVARLVGRVQPRRRIERPLTALYRLSLGRRAWSVADGVVVIAMIVALGAALAVFTASYDAAKTSDSRYATGSDLRITPSPGTGPTDPAAFDVAGIDALSPVVFDVHNAVIRSARTSDVANLAAVDPDSFARVAPLDSAASVGPGATGGSAALPLVPGKPGIALSGEMADFLQAEVGDDLAVLLARGTDDQVEITLPLVGRYDRLPGFPDGAQALMDLDRYRSEVPSAQPDFYLARTADPSGATLHRVVRELHAAPGAGGRLQIDTRETTLAKDQSSLAALNIRGLVDLDSGYGLAMGAVAVGIFVFGLLLQRRREYVTLRAQGLPPGQIRSLIVGEAGTVAVAGCAVGLLVGAIMALYLVAVLRPLFVLAPSIAFPPVTLAAAVASVLAAAALTATAGTAMVDRLSPTELLREE